MATHSPSLYALLVGVNAYPFLAPDKQLKGCISDLELFRGYLNEDFVKTQFKNIHIKTLTSPAQSPADTPTKDNIVAAFHNHLGQAKAGDVALFYFSGHGVREVTKFKPFRDEEIDSNIGGVVCPDFNNPRSKSPDQTVLCDKEIRYLIKELAEDKQGKPRAHVVTVFDCCHSGENTRAVLTEDLPSSARQIERGAIRGRDWEGYIFHTDERIAKMVREERKLAEILPQGKHVMLAACREVELAWEGAGQSGGVSNGAFTLALVDVLRQHKGHISYHELYSRVLNRMRFNMLQGDRLDKRQTPQFYIRTEQPSERYNLFLTNRPNDQPTECAVEFNAAENEWRVDVGALHGVPIDPASHPTEVKIFPISNRNQTTTAQVAQVFPTYSVIRLPGSFQPGNESYRGVVGGLGIRPLHIFLSGEKEGVDFAAKELTQRLNNVQTQLFKLVPDENQADYVLFAQDGRYQTRLPFETRPLIKSVAYRNQAGKPVADSLDIIFNNVQQMARWTFLKDLEYIPTAHKEAAKGDQTMFPVELRVFEYDEEKEKEDRLFPNGDKFTIDMPSADSQRLLRFELVNHAPQELYVSLIYMPFNFGFNVDEDSRIMKEAQMGLAQNGVLKSYPVIDKENGEGYLPLVIEPYTSRYNLIGEENFLKMIVSSTPFDITTFHMDPLPTPDVEDTRGSKGFFTAKKEPAIPKVQWEVRTFEIFVSNPEYVPKKSTAEG